MLDRDAVDAVLFDIGGVFLVPNGPVIRDWFERAGFDVAAEEAAYRRAHYEGVRALADLGTPGTGTDASFWRHYDDAYLGAIGIPRARLPEAREAFGALALSPSLELWTGVLEDNVAAFARIAASGMAVGIVSNNDGTAEAQLLRHEICQVGPGELPAVVCVVDSAVHGVAKPDPAIFAPALDALGVTAPRALYVGDTVHADVAGARAAGLQVVQVDPYDLHAGFDHARVPDIGTLADWLLAG